MRTVRDYATQYMRRGWKVIPLRPGSKAPTGNAWQRTEISEDHLDLLFTDDAGIGVRLGTPSGNIVDVDLDDPYTRAMARAFLPETGARFGRAGSPCSHWLYKILGDAAIKRRQFSDIEQSSSGANKTTVLVEVRGDGHQTRFPPSVHTISDEEAETRHIASGTKEPVTWIDEGDPATIDLDALMAAVGKLSAAAMMARGWHLWNDHHHLVSLHLAGGMYRAGISPDEIESFVRTIAENVGDQEVEDRCRAARDTCAKMLSGEDQISGWPSLGEIIGAERVKKLRTWLQDKSADFIGNTDQGNAGRMIAHFGEEVRFVPGIGWFIWDGNRWREDKTEQIIGHYATQIPTIITSEALRAGDGDQRAALNKWAAQTQNVTRLLAIPRLARTDDRVVALATDLDPDPYLYNVRNGTVDLRTGGIIPHDRENLITKISPVDYNAAAQCPLWLEFLALVTNEDEQLVNFLQLLAGYTLTGDTREQAFVIMWGPPGTGKTTFVETLRYIMGEYAANADPKTFMAKPSQSRVSSDLARLMGARFVTTGETEQNERLAVALIKRISGSTKLTVANLYQTEFEYEPVFKLWIDTNHKPKTGNDTGIWDRLLMVPFTNVIRHTPRDQKDYKRVLRTEAPGILAWAVRGAQKWLATGLGDRPDVMKEATDEYRQESDQIRTFLEDSCEVGDPRSGHRAGASDLFAAYQAWAQTNGERFKFSSRAFKAELEGRGFTLKRYKTGMEWLGLKITAPQTEQAGPWNSAQAQANPFANGPQA